MILYLKSCDPSPERKQEVADSKAGGDSGSESAAGVGAPDDDCGSSTASSGFGSLTKKNKNYGERTYSTIHN